jgi:hypothetical protein
VETGDLRILDQPREEGTKKLSLKPNKSKLGGIAQMVKLLPTCGKPWVQSLVPTKPNIFIL